MLRDNGTAPPLVMPDTAGSARSGDMIAPED